MPGGPAGEIGVHDQYDDEHQREPTNIAKQLGDRQQDDGAPSDTNRAGMLKLSSLTVLTPKRGLRK